MFCDCLVRTCDEVMNKRVDCTPAHLPVSRKTKRMKTERLYSSLYSAHGEMVRIQLSLLTCSRGSKLQVRCCQRLALKMKNVSQDHFCLTKVTIKTWCQTVSQTRTHEHTQTHTHIHVCTAMRGRINGADRPLNSITMTDPLQYILSRIV